jgi:membrane fusion protein, heavy metal efflux system
MKTFITTALLCLWATLAVAGPGHDHGDEAPAAGGTASPRVTAVSDLFELVGIVDHDTMTIYLDRHDSNEPVLGARIEVEAGPAKGVATAQPDGTYRFQHAVLDQPAALAVTFTVSAGDEVDLLAGDLDLRKPETPTAGAAGPWGGALAYALSYAVWAAGGAVLLAAAYLITRRLRSQRVAP